MNWQRNLILLVFLLCSSPARAEVETVPLKHRTVEQVIPILRPLLESAGALTGMNNQLVIRAGRKNITELRRVLDSIDVAPRRLMIYVRQESGGSSKAHGARVTGNAAAGGVGVSSGLGGHAIERRLSAQIADSRSAGEERVVQQVQAVEGAPALIQVGQSMPVTNRTTVRSPNAGIIVSDTMSYRDVTVGFEVVPRIAAEYVQVEISPRRDTVESEGGIGIQRIASNASGKVGEWFELESVTEDESRQSSGLVAGTVVLRQDNRRVWVKVEEIK